MLTLEEKLARFLAVAVWQLGGSLQISKELIDSMVPVRLVLDETSETDQVTLAVINNDVITIVIDKAGAVEVQ